MLLDTPFYVLTAVFTFHLGSRFQKSNQQFIIAVIGVQPFIFKEYIDILFFELVTLSSVREIATDQNFTK
jgi:hypothetical protein